MPWILIGPDSLKNRHVAVMIQLTNYLLLITLGPFNHVWAENGPLVKAMVTDPTSDRSRRRVPVPVFHMYILYLHGSTLPSLGYICS